MSIVHKFSGDPNQEIYSWEGVKSIQSTNPMSLFTKSVLVGSDDDAPTFAIRYFQLPIEGASPLHQHPHEHGVIILHGNAQLRINDNYYDLSALDSVFITGEELHQFKNTGEETLGFICVVPKYGEF